MVRVAAIGIGALSGAALSVAALFVLGSVGGDLLGSGWVFAIATPGAHVVSWILRWPLQQEAAIACYALGLLGEVALFGAATGALAAVLATEPRDEGAGSGSLEA